MTDITKLADEWRNDEAGFQVVTHDARLSCHNGLTCATELTAALPKWTRITDDPATKPTQEMVMTATWYDGWIATTISSEELEVDDDWRPLCDLDYPPGEQL